MITQELDVYSEASNYGIVRMPGRRFPGCVIQGDSLFILLKNAKSVLEGVRLKTNDEELLTDMEGLVHSLEERLDHYEAVLQQHGIRLPYCK